MSYKDWKNKEKEQHEWEEAMRRERNRLSGIDLSKEINLDRKQSHREEQIKDKYKDLIHSWRLLITKEFGLLYVSKYAKDEKVHKETQDSLVKAQKELIKILNKMGTKDAFEEIIIDCKNTGIANAKEKIADAENQRKINFENILSEIIKSDNETITEENKCNPFSFPTFENFQFPVNKIKDKKKIRSLVSDLVNAYDQLDIDYLEDDDNVEENKYTVRALVKSVLSKNGRKNFTSYIDDLEDDINQYSDMAKSLVNLIFDIYESDLSKMEDETGKLKFPFALESKKIRDFLSNHENSLNDKISKIIDVTDNFIDRLDKELNTDK